MLDYLVICLPAANDGNIIGKLAPNINTTLSTLSSTVSLISNFSSTISPYLSNITTAYNAGNSLITQYRSSKLPDITDSGVLA